MILVYVPDLFQFVKSGAITKIVNFAIGKVAPVAAIVALVTAVVSIILLSLGEPKQHKGRLVFSIVLTVVALIISIVALVTVLGGKNG